MRPLQLLLGPAYDDTAEQIETRLQPVDMMEASLVAQIVRAHQRLQLCEKLENPASPDAERVRNHAEGSIRRNLAELRQFQADRHLNTKLQMDAPGVARVKDILQSSVLAQKLGTPSSPSSSQPSVADLESRIARVMTKEQELSEANLKIRTHSGPSPSPAASLSPGQPAHQTGRNTPCACNSGKKYKRCCGSGAPPVYQNAA